MKKSKYLTSKLLDLYEYKANTIYHWGIKMELAVDPKYLLVRGYIGELSPQQLSALKRGCKDILGREPKFTLQLLPCRP